MKNRTLSKILSVFLAVAIVFCSAPLSGFTGIELPELFSVKAKAVTAPTKYTQIYENEKRTVRVSSTGETYIKIVPEYNFLYTITFSSSYYAWVTFYDADMNELASNSGSGDGSSFSISYKMIAGHTYYCAIGVEFRQVSVSVELTYEYCDHNFSDEDSICTNCGQSYFIYNISDDEVEITGCVDPTGDVVIPSTLDGFSVTSIGDDAFYECTSLTSVTIPDSVTSIGKRAFCYCTNLKELTLPVTADFVCDYYEGSFLGCEGIEKVTLTKGTDGKMIDYFSETEGYLYYYTPWYISGCSEIVIEQGVTSISDNAFGECESLTSVTIPDSVTSIGAAAFEYCRSLTSVTIPDSVTSIGGFAFYGCSDLKTVVLPDGIDKISGQMFGRCMSLTDVIIPDSVEIIEYAAFRSCENLKSVMISDKIRIIEDEAFSWCKSLVSLNLSANLSNIGLGVFAGCVNLERISVDSNNVYYSSDEEGILYNKDKTELLIYPMGKTQQTYIVPEYVESIGTYAFSGDYGEITDLQMIILHDNIKRIDMGAFVSCGSLQTIEIPGSITEISEYAFGQCVELKTVTVCNGVTTIKEGAFADCTELSSIIISNSVKDIGDSAFTNCEKLTDVYYTGTEEEWNEIAIGSDNESLLAATIHFFGDEERPVFASGECGDELTWNLYLDGELEITGTGAMYDYGWRDAPWYSNSVYVKKVNIANGVTSIGSLAFYNCTSLTSITIPDSVTSIGSLAFNCTSLTSITIPDSVTSIGEGAFLGCTSLTSIVIPDSVTSIGEGTFGECQSLTSIIIPDSVTSIGEQAFFDCTNLTSVTIGKGVSSIGLVPFIYCTNLTSIVVSEDNDFYSNDEYGVLFDKDKTTLICCHGGKEGSYVIPDSVTSIGIGAFYGCTSLTSVVIPDSVTSIDNYAFSECESLTSVTIPDSVTSIGDSAFSYCDNLTNVYYRGTEEEWNKITIDSGNGPLTNATIYFKCEHVQETVIENKIEATCAETGSYDMVVYCSVCGEELCRKTETIPALAHTWSKWVVATEATETSDGTKVRICKVCEDAAEIEEIPAIGSGSGEEPSTGITITLTDENGNVIIKEIISDYNTDISFENGTYTLTISKENYVSRTYTVTATDNMLSVDFSLHKIGDMNGDGRVNTVDVARANAHAKGMSTLSGYDFDCVDINGDGRVNTVDVAKMNAHAKGVTTLW